MYAQRRVRDFSYGAGRARRRRTQVNIAWRKDDCDDLDRDAGQQ
jgi:hypothetical protein